VTRLHNYTEIVYPPTGGYPSKY